MELKSPSYAMCARFLLLIVFLLAGSDVFALDSGAAAKIEYSMERADVLSYPLPLSAYERADGVCATLLSRIREQPFNLFASAVFILAILHTFAHRYFVKLSEKLKLRLREHLGRGESISESRRDFSFFMSGLFHMLGEVELIFGFWLVPLFIGFWACFGWQDLGAYLNSLMFDQRKFVEPVFVIVVMCMAGTRPVIHASAGFVGLFSKAIGGGGRFVVDCHIVHRAIVGFFCDGACGDNDMCVAFRGSFLFPQSVEEVLLCNAWFAFGCGIRGGNSYAFFGAAGFNGG